MSVTYAVFHTLYPCLSVVSDLHHPPTMRAVIAIAMLAAAAAQNSNANENAFNDKFNGWAAGNGKQYLTAEE